MAVHSHNRQNEGDAGFAVVHILRFEEEKIIEFWDIAQAIPGDRINKEGMF